MLTTSNGSRIIIFSAVGAVIVACSSNNSSSGTGGGTGTGSDPTVSNSDCTSGCQSKATSCKAPAGTAQSQCASICSGTVTQSQLTCLNAAPCTTLSGVNDSASFSAACPPGGDSGGSDAGGGSCKAIAAACGMDDCCAVPKCVCPDGTTSSIGICFNGSCQGCSGFCLDHDGATQPGKCPKLKTGDPCGDARSDGCFTCPSGTCVGNKCT